MTKETSQRRAQLAHYIEELDEFSWHHPNRVTALVDSQHARQISAYYLAQISLVLFHNYQQSYGQIATLLRLSSRTVYKYVNANQQAFQSLDDIKKALTDGQDW